MDLTDILKKAEKLTADIKSAVDKAGPGGTRIVLTEWTTILSDGVALVTAIAKVIPVAASLLG